MPDQTQALDQWLQRHAEVLMSDVTDQEHLDDETLAATVNGQHALSIDQLKHLAECSECRAVVIELGREYSQPALRLSPIKTWGRWLWIAAPIAAAVIAMLNIDPNQSSQQDFQHRGAVGATMTAEVAFLVTGEDGVQRDLKAGDSVSLKARLGFRYGNPDGTHKSLTIVGWDGSRLHWYYPETPDGEALTVKTGINHRLPFDVGLDDHTPGELTIVAAFDLTPEQLAQRVQTNALQAPHMTTLKVRIAP